MGEKKINKTISSNDSLPQKTFLLGFRPLDFCMNKIFSHVKIFCSHVIERIASHVIERIASHVNERIAPHANEGLGFRPLDFCMNKIFSHVKIFCSHVIERIASHVIERIASHVNERIAPHANEGLGFRV